MTQLTFATSALVTASPNRGFTNLELADWVSGARMVAQLDISMAAELSAKLSDVSGAAAEPSAVATERWRPIVEHDGYFPVLVCRERGDGEFYETRAAFLDAGGTWRVLGSEGGNTPLNFAPTLFCDLPEPPALGQPRP